MKKKTIILFIAVTLLLVLSLSACGLFGGPQAEQEIVILYDTQGGTPISSTKLPRSQITAEFIASQETTKEGFDVDYWYVLNNGKRDKNISNYLKQTTLPDTIKVGVVWKVKILTVTVSQNLDTAEAKFAVKVAGEKQTEVANPFTVEVEYDQSVEVIVDDIYSVEGLGDFTFVNWEIYTPLKEVGEGGECSIENVKTNVDFVAVWKSPKEIDIDFYNNIETTETPETKSLGVGLTHTVTPTNTKVGSMFDGWCTTKDDPTTKISDSNGYITSFPKTDTPENTSVYAHWESSISVSYSVNSEDEIVVTGINPSYIIKGIKRIYIPSKIASQTVSEIADDAFKDLSQDYDVIIPYTIDTVSASAFENYQGNIYFDMASNYNLISPLRFSPSHNIYVHATNVDKVTSVNEFKNSYRSGTASLIDGAFINYFGEIVTDYTNNLDKISLWHRYSIEFTLENDIALNCAGYPSFNFNKVMDDLNNLSITVIANDTARGGSSWSGLGKTMKIPKQTLKTTKRVAEEKTPGADRQDQVIDLLYEEGDFSDIDKYLPIEFLPEIPVFNSEQAMRVVQEGYQPLFISKTDGAPRNYSTWAKEAYDAAISTVKKITSEEMTAFEKINAIHDWIVVNNIYDSTLLDYFKNYTSDQISHFRGFYLEGVLLDGRGVCDSISKTFLVMTRAAGIEAIKVEGTSLGGGGGTGVAHAWNKVKVKDKWYVVDVTGNDPIISDDGGALNGGKSIEISKHTYYLVPNSDKLLQKKNVEKEGMGYPVATGNYDYFGNKTYDGVRSIKVNSTQELKDYLNWVKANKQRETGKLYSIEVYVASSLIDASDIAWTVFGSEYLKRYIGDPKGHCVLFIRKK